MSLFSLTSAALDPQECHLVAGFNNSVIQLWQMNQHSTRGKHLYVCSGVRQCNWDINNLKEENEDEMEEDIRSLHTTRNEKIEYLREKYDKSAYEDNL